MRKINAVITALIVLLFLAHMIWGGLELAGMTKGGSRLFEIISRMLLTLIAFHAVIGVITTVQTLKTMKSAGVSYFRQNLLFWIRRISGFALMLFIAAHVILFLGTRDGGIYRLRLFSEAGLAGQILMVAALLVHLLGNITPLRIALGIEDKKQLWTDFLVVFAILLLMAAAAFVVYYIRWTII